MAEKLGRLPWAVHAGGYIDRTGWEVLVDLWPHHGLTTLAEAVAECEQCCVPAHYLTLHALHMRHRPSDPWPAMLGQDAGGPQLYGPAV